MEIEYAKNFAISEDKTLFIRSLEYILYLNDLLSDDEIKKIEM